MSRSTSPVLTLEITRGPCKVLVYGKRSTKGWNVVRTDGAHNERQGHRKTKDEALQLALDACEPGVMAVFSVRPST